MTNLNWLSYAQSAGDYIASWNGNGNTSDHSNAVFDKAGNTYVYRGINSNGFVMKFSPNGELLWRFKITLSDNDTILSPEARLVRIGSLASNNFVSFPSYRPTSRSYAPPKYGFSTTYTIDNRAFRTISASVAGQGALSLVYENITDGEAYEFIRCYEQCYGAATTFTLPEGVLAGLSSNLLSMIAPGGEFYSWRWNRPPKVESVSRGRSTVSVSLIALEASDEIFVLSCWTAQSPTRTDWTYSNQTYLIGYNAKGAVLYANEYTNNATPYQALVPLSYDTVSNTLLGLGPSRYLSPNGTAIVSINPYRGTVVNQVSIASASPRSWPDQIRNLCTDSSGRILLTGQPYLIQLSQDMKEVTNAYMYQHPLGPDYTGFHSSYLGMASRPGVKAGSDNFIFSSSRSNGVYYEVDNELNIAAVKESIVNPIRVESDPSGYLYITTDRAVDGYASFNDTYISKIDWNSNSVLWTTKVQKQGHVQYRPLTYLDIQGDRLAIVPSNAQYAYSYLYSCIAGFRTQLTSSVVLNAPNPVNVSLTGSTNYNSPYSLTPSSISPPFRTEMNVSLSSAVDFRLLRPLQGTITYESDAYTIVSYAS